MNNSKFLVVLFLALGCTAGAARAQESLSLKGYRERVINYSNSLKMSEQANLAAEHKYKASRAGYYPSLSFAADANYMVNMPTFAGLTLKNYTYSANLAIQQNVYTGNAVTNQTKAAKIEQNIASLDQLTARDNVIYGADVTYWSLAASVVQRDVAKEYVDIIASLLQTVNERFENGYVSRTDLLMVQTRMNEANIQLTAAEKLYYTSVQNFNTMLGNVSPQSYSVADSIFRIEPIDYSGSTLDMALDRRPDYLSASSEVELQDRLRRLSRAKYNPQIVAGIQGVYGTSNPNISGAANIYGVAYASVRIPLFSWGERRNTVAQATYGLRAKEFALLDSRDRVNQELNNAKISLKQSFEQTQIAIANLKVSQENLDLNTYSYSEGRLPILDVLQSQVSWIQAYTSSVNACYQYQVAVADYQKALGQIDL